MAEETDEDVPASVGAGAPADFAAASLRIRTAAQAKYARPALQKLNEIAMGDQGKANPVQMSALRELLDQTLGRPYAPALSSNPHEESLAIIERRGEELRLKLDRMAATEPPGSAEPVDESRTG